jgi:hypothetical protein
MALPVTSSTISHSESLSSSDIATTRTVLSSYNDHRLQTKDFSSNYHHGWQFDMD